MIKNSNKNHFLVLSLIIFFSFSVSILIFSPVSFVNIAKALNPSDYNKLTGASLGVADWNRLDADFVIKSGDTMQGAIDMANNQITNIPAPTTNDQAVNKGYVDAEIVNQVSSVVTNTAGASIKMICGRTSPADWATHDNLMTDVTVPILFPAGSFSTVPEVMSSIYGDQQHWKTYGANSIYDLTATGFRIYIHSLGLPVDDTIAQSWGGELVGVLMVTKV